MKIIEQLQDIEKPFKNAAITIGNFDGVHIGHQALFHTVIEKADAIGGTSVAMTFKPHPLRVLSGKRHCPSLITMHEQKAELIARSGIDVLLSIPFNQEFASITAREFVGDLLVGRIGVRAIVVGWDYQFGRQREGNLDLLKEWAPELGYEVVVVDWIQALNGIEGRISSTRIREMIAAGQVDEAKKLLGRHYQIRGRVTAGRNRGGRLLGFPTANVTLQDELCPHEGIYAVTVELQGEIHKGVANIGYSPTFDDRIFTIEVHILDFDKNIYGQPIRVNFIQRLRDEIRFSSIEALSEQIGKDIELARDILAGF